MTIQVLVVDDEEDVETLFRLWDEGKIAPVVSATYPLARGGDAIAALAARSVIGKVVVTLE